MTSIKKLCREMAADPRILTFSEIGVAAARGVLAGQKINSPFAGAVIAVSVIASQRAAEISLDLFEEIRHGKSMKSRQ